ncbi:unnamed protein product [Orchesella dallaii]|uniref:Uncharacterized protein n=1 Tax=Orchesella dallaii TaxID=48710 RepID=A0ABP1RHY6_9HEXA
MSHQYRSSSLQQPAQNTNAVTSELVPVTSYNSHVQYQHYNTDEQPIQTISTSSSFNTMDQEILSLELLDHMSFQYSNNMTENYYAFKWLQTEYNKLAVDLQATKTNEIHLRNESGSLKHKCNSQQLDIMKLKRELNLLQANSMPKSQYDQILKENKAVADDNRKLKSQNEQLIKDTGQIHSLEEENRKLQFKLELQKSQVDLWRQLEDAENNKITEAEATIQKLKSENKDLLRKFESAKDECEKGKLSNVEAFKKFEAQLVEKELNIERLREKNQNLQKDLQQSNETLEYELERADREKSTLMELCKIVKILNKKVETQKKEVIKKSQQILDLKKLIKVINIAESKKNIGKVNMGGEQQKIQQKKSVLLMQAQIEVLKNLQPELKRSIECQEKTRYAIQNRLKDFTAKFKPVANKSELDNLQKQNQEYLKELKVKDDEILSQNEKIAGYQKCVDSLHATISKLQNDLKTKDKKGTEQDAEIRKLNKRLEFVHKENQGQNSTIGRLQKELGEARTCFVSLSQQKSPNELLWERNNEVTRLNGAVKNLTAALSTANAEIGEKNKSIDGLRRKWQSENTLRVEQMDRNDEKLAELSKLLVKKSKDLQKAEKIIVSLNNDVNILKTNVHEIDTSKLEKRDNRGGGQETGGSSGGDDQDVPRKKVRLDKVWVSSMKRVYE